MNRWRSLETDGKRRTDDKDHEPCGNGGVQVACFGVGHGFGVDAGMEIWAEGKASVCKGIWWKWIGKRPAVNGVVSELETLRSDG